METVELVLNPQQARQIIAVAKEGFAFDGDVPESDDACVKIAKELVESADAARDSVRGEAKETVDAVLRLAEDPPFTPGDEVIAQPEEKPFPKQKSSPHPPTVHSDELMSNEELALHIAGNNLFAKDSVTTTAVTSYYESRMAETEARKRKLPIPQEYDGEQPELPRDLSLLDDSALASLYSRFHACHSYVVWLLSIEEIDLDSAKSIYNDLLSKSMRDINRDAGSKTAVTLVKQEALANPEVDNWRKQVAKHEAQVKVYKALRDIYDGTCTRISRLHSFRQDERDGAKSSYQAN